ncbi:Histidine kinase-, DNA gyrase B-, and HSP90-like ATPase [Pustulibacterium marinum]|uniref:histidine kinase n=1 Tax=Pustulibacterium marinum TaxID=1224947 RepID=A0A1I7IBI1_9FLAO|nr:HAMP domain-containing sensor histidine kinase [Pustulibacterium marinum]SFU70248.1 Histidine kinase-, DNA gyrase B-, and HSP90-like ATPase [Pustulibacterium marinum]
MVFIKSLNLKLSFFFLQKLAASVIVLIALVNIAAWITGNVGTVNFQYHLNEKATMKVITAVSFLLVGLCHFFTKRRFLYPIFLGGIAIQLLQLCSICIIGLFRPSSPITIFLFLVTFLEMYVQGVHNNTTFSMILNSLVYVITTFTIYYFVLNPTFLGSIPGFKSLSWNTAILFYINSLSSLQRIFRKNIKEVFQYNDDKYNLNPFKYFPVFFGIPIAVIIIVTLLIHVNLIGSKFGIFIILFILNVVTLVSAAIFTKKFVKLFKIILVTQKQVQYKNEKLKEKNRYLEDFASISSHNLKEPIIALNNLIDFREKEEFKDTVPPEEIDQMITTNIKNLSKNIDSINKFLQAIRKGEKGNFIYVSVKESIEEQLGLLKDFSKQINATTTINIRKDTLFPKVYIDSILYNLISNSYKYNDKKRPLSIFIDAYFDNKDYVIIYRDNGIGIDMEKHGDQLFKPNKRFHKTNVPSSGFGLYFTKMHIQKMDGTITAKSTLDVGTEFTLIFKNKKDDTHEKDENSNRR